MRYDPNARKSVKQNLLQAFQIFYLTSMFFAGFQKFPGKITL